MFATGGMAVLLAMSVRCYYCHIKYPSVYDVIQHLISQHPLRKISILKDTPTSGGISINKVAASPDIRRPQHKAYHYNIIPADLGANAQFVIIGDTVWFWSDTQTATAYQPFFNKREGLGKASNIWSVSELDITASQRSESYRLTSTGYHEIRDLRNFTVCKPEVGLSARPSNLDLVVAPNLSMIAPSPSPIPAHESVTSGINRAGVVNRNTHKAGDKFKPTQETTPNQPLEHSWKPVKHKNKIIPPGKLKSKKSNRTKKAKKSKPLLGGLLSFCGLKSKKVGHKMTSLPKEPLSEHSSESDIELLKKKDPTGVANENIYTPLPCHKSKNPYADTASSNSSEGRNDLQKHERLVSHPTIDSKRDHTQESIPVVSGVSGRGRLALKEISRSPDEVMREMLSSVKPPVRMSSCDPPQDLSITSEQVIEEPGVLNYYSEPIYSEPIRDSVTHKHLISPEPPAEHCVLNEPVFGYLSPPGTPLPLPTVVDTSSRSQPISIPNSSGWYDEIDSSDLLSSSAATTTSGVISLSPSPRSTSRSISLMSERHPHVTSSNTTLRSNTSVLTAENVVAKFSSAEDRASAKRSLYANRKNQPRKRELSVFTTCLVDISPSAYKVLPLTRHPTEEGSNTKLADKSTLTDTETVPVSATETQTEFPQFGLKESGTKRKRDVEEMTDGIVAVKANVLDSPLTSSQKILATEDYHDSSVVLGKDCEPTSTCSNPVSDTSNKRRQLTRGLTFIKSNAGETDGRGAHGPGVRVTCALCRPTVKTSSATAKITPPHSQQGTQTTPSVEALTPGLTFETLQRTTTPEQFEIAPSLLNAQPSPTGLKRPPDPDPSSRNSERTIADSSGCPNSTGADVGRPCTLRELGCQTGAALTVSLAEVSPADQQDVLEMTCLFPKIVAKATSSGQLQDWLQLMRSAVESPTGSLGLFPGVSPEEVSSISELPVSGGTTEDDSGLSCCEQAPSAFSEDDEDCAYRDFMYESLWHSSTHKYGIDTRIRFSIEPLPGDDAFQQWKDAMKAVARLPLGIPPEFRKKVWLALADHHIASIKLDWEKTKRFAFNERSNPDDNKLGLQIVKDLHRTGCSGFSGQDNEGDRAVLKRVLLAYARWNKRVGYCQGFNVLAALILEVMQRKEDDALKVMIFLIDHVLPESYFANNLRALSVDMAVFRDLLRLMLPQLSKHLDHLQSAARDDTTGANYEPPLTNVFTMQWFLTVFATCLPKATALRVWDSVILEGSEILLRTAVAIWGKLQDRILTVQSADEFYTTMGILTQEMLDNRIATADELLKMVYATATFPMPQLSELREKYTYNITPFSAAMATGQKPTRTGGMNIFSDEDEIDEDDIVDNITCFAGIFPGQISPSKNRTLGESDRSHSASAYDISKVSPGAYAAHPEFEGENRNSGYMERMTMDIDMLRKQYKRLRVRQKQAHIILAAASARHQERHSKAIKPPMISSAVAHIESPVAVNHLFIGRRNSSNRRNRHIAKAPVIAPMYKAGVISPQLNFEAESVVSDISMSKDSAHPGPGEVRKPRIRTVSGTSLYSELTEDAQSTCTNAELESIQSDITDVASVDMDLADRSRHLSQMSSDGTASEADHEIPEVGPPGLGASDSDTVADSGSECSYQGTLSSDSLEPTSNKHRSDQSEKETDAKNESSEEKPDHDNNNVDKSEDSNCKDHKADMTPTSLLELAKKADKGSFHEKIQKQISVSRADPGLVRQKSVSSDNLGLAARGQIKRSASTNEALQEYQRSKWLSSTSSSQISDERTSDTDTASVSSGTSAKTFNPFPSRHVNRKRTENGIRLGLYTADNVPVMDGFTRKQSNVATKQIGRSQINQCLHRQYMAEVREHNRGHKH